MPTAESGEGRRARERVRERGVAARSGRSLVRSPGRSAAAILLPVAARSPSRLSPLGLLCGLRLAESVVKEVGAGDPSSPVGTSGEGGSRGKRGGGTRSGSKRRSAGPASRRGLRCSGRDYLGWRGCGRPLTQTPGMRQGEPAAGKGEASDDEGAPPPDAGQRRPRASFVIPPLGGGEGLGRAPEGGCPPALWSLGQPRSTENLQEGGRERTLSRPFSPDLELRRECVGIAKGVPPTPHPPLSCLPRR